MKITLSPEMAKELKAQGERGKQALEAARAQLVRLVKPLTYRFNKDHSFMVSSDEMSKTVKGKWSMKGRSIVVKMDNPQRSTPNLTLSQDGRSIITVYRHPTMTGTMSLIRKK